MKRWWFYKWRLFLIERQELINYEAACRSAKKDMLLNQIARRKHFK